MQVSATRSYRCSYHPKDTFGTPIAAESGVLPFVQIKAANAEQAQRAAFHVTGCPIASVERQDGGAA